MGKYRLLGSLWDNLFRNNLNANFNEVDTDIKAQKKRVDDLIVGNPQPSEVVDARGGHVVLRDRLNDLDASLAQKVTKGAAEIQPEDLSEETLGLVTGTGTVNLLTIPQPDSVTYPTLTDDMKANFDYKNFENMIADPLPTTSTGWLPTGCTVTYDATEQAVKLSGNAGTAAVDYIVIETANASTYIGKYIYIRVKVKSDSVGGRLYLMFGTDAGIAAMTTYGVTTGYEEKQVYAKVPSGFTGRIFIKVYNNTPNATVYWKEISFVDVTKAFGAGNEPLSLGDLNSYLDSASIPHYIAVNETKTLIKKALVAETANEAVKIKNKGLKVKYDKTLNQVSACYKISPLKNGKVVIAKTGNNSLMMLKQFEYLTGSNLAYFESGGSVIGGTTDWISPMKMYANANGDGDLSYTTTGGNHLMNGGVTAWTRKYNVFVDGKLLTETSEVLDADEVIIKVRNQIVGYNTYSLGRVILDEYVTYTIKDGTVFVEVRLVPIEDLTMLIYYGLQFTSTLADYFTSIQYVNSLNKEINATVINGTNAGALSEEILDTFILSGNNVKFIGYVDSTFGLGTRENSNPTDVSFGINGVKLYSNLIMKSTPMSARKPYAWRGSYKMLGVS